MTWRPITLTAIQYYDPITNTPYSAAVLKPYSAGTTTPINFSIDAAGSVLVGSVAIDSSGYPSVSGNVIIPHIEEDFKLSLYPSQAAADSNTGAVWTIDNLSTDLSPLFLGQNITFTGDNTFTGSTTQAGDIEFNGDAYFNGGKIGINKAVGDEFLEVGGSIRSTAAAADLSTGSNGVSMDYAGSQGRITTTVTGGDLSLQRQGTELVSLKSDGVHLTNDLFYNLIKRLPIYQSVSSSTSIFTSTTNTIPLDNTTPTNTEGESSGVSVVIQPKTSTSTLFFFATGFVDSSTSASRIMTLCDTSVSSVLKTSASHANAGGRIKSLPMIYNEVSGSTTSRTYEIRFGSSSGTSYINGISSGALFGGSMRTSLTIIEVEL